MAVIKFQWFSGAPGDKSPALHITCLTNEAYTMPRWWDGEQWWDVSISRGSPARPFKWPKGFGTGPLRRFVWMAKRPLTLRKITDQSKVRFGLPYKHFEPNEVLQWLVDQGKLPADWKEAFQDDMRAKKPTKEAE